MSLEFRYRRLGYVALNVTDSGRADEFYQTMVGLGAAGEAFNGESLYRCTAHHHDVILHQADTAGLRRVAWEMESQADLEKIRAHLHASGISPHAVPAEECAALGIDNAFRVTEPTTGATFEYFDTMNDAASTFEPSVTKIARLGHVVLGTADHAASERFFVDQLNYRVSDRIDSAVTFMRCFPNPLHHSLGLSNADNNRLHHVNFMVTDIDDIGKALWRAKKMNVPVVFGPGRHPPSESIFLYFLEPDGMTLEYSFGMEEFPEAGAREPRLLPMSLESIDFWGAIPEAAFGANGAIEPLVA